MPKTAKRKFLIGGAEKFLYGPKATAKFAKFAKRVAQFATVTPIGILRAVKPKKRKAPTPMQGIRARAGTRLIKEIVTGKRRRRR